MRRSANSVAVWSLRAEPGLIGEAAEWHEPQRGRQAYPHLIYYNQVDKGGHFAAWEQRQLFSQELRAAFRTLR